MYARIVGGSGAALPLSLHAIERCVSQGLFRLSCGHWRRPTELAGSMTTTAGSRQDGSLSGTSEITA